MSTPIQVQSTPNPNARKFILHNVEFPGSVNYSSAEAAASAPLPWIGALFALEGVYNVFTAQNFVTVNKRNEVDWNSLEEQICAILHEAFAQTPPRR